MTCYRIGTEYSSALEKEMTTHSSTLAWRIPWRLEPGRLQSMESQRVGHDWVTSLFFFFFSSTCMDLLRLVTIIFITYTIVWPQVNSREGTRLHPSIENWIDDLLSMPLPMEQDPVSPSVSVSHQEVSISLLSFSIRGQTDWKLQSQKTNQSNHLDHIFV